MDQCALFHRLRYLIRCKLVNSFSMFKSPHNLKSGTKGKPVPFSSDDKIKIGRSLAGSSAPTETEPYTRYADSIRIKSLS